MCIGPKVSEHVLVSNLLLKFPQLSHSSCETRNWVEEVLEVLEGEEAMKKLKE